MRMREIITIKIERCPDAMSVEVKSEGTLRILANPIWVTSSFPELVIVVTPEGIEFKQRTAAE